MLCGSALSGITTETAAEAAFQPALPFPPPQPRKRAPTKPRAAFPDGLDEFMFQALRDACKRNGRRGPREITPGMRDALQKLYAAEKPTMEDIAHAISVREKMDRDGEGFGDLNWEHLCRAASFRRYRDHERPKSGRAKPWTPSDFGEGSTP
jgi:hypothetical protein